VISAPSGAPRFAHATRGGTFGGVDAAASVVERFLAALERRDFEALGACFGPGARLRALVPAMLREEEGPDAIAARFRFWFADVEEFEVLESEVGRTADRTRFGYTLAGVKPEHGSVVVEQRGYVDVDDGLISGLSLVCSGFCQAA
jgi:hypothetical protein